MAFNGIFPAEPLVVAPFGILSVADVIHPTDDQWIRGYAATFMSHPQEVDVLSVRSGRLDGDTGVVYKAADDQSVSPYEDVLPFYVQVTSKGTTMGVTSMADRQASLLNQLEVTTQKAIEFENWTGNVIEEDGTNQSYLTKNTSTVITTGAVAPKKALTLIEGAIAGSPSGTGGVIHVSRELGSSLTFMGAIKAVDNVGKPGQHLETVLGTQVIVGSGYLGTSPNGVADPSADQQWMYATGPVTVILGDAEITANDPARTVNTRTNDLSMVALRAVSVHFDPSIFYAAQVTMPEAP